MAPQHNSKIGTSECNSTPWPRTMNATYLPSPADTEESDIESMFGNIGDGFQGKHTV